MSTQVPTENLHLEATDEGALRLYESYAQYWHPVAYVDDLRDRPLPVRLMGREIVLARLDGAPRAFHDLCLHRGTPLSLGTIEGSVLRCAYHGWAYDCTGRCVEIPSVPSLRPPSKAQLREYRCAEAAGMIFVSLVDEPTFPLPECPYLDDPEFRVLRVPAYDWNCAVPRRVENVLDFAHFPFVHDGLLGYRDEPEVPEHVLQRNDAELWIEIAMDEPTTTGKNSRAAIGSDRMTTSKSYRLFMPFTAMNQQTYENGRKYVLFWGFSPIDIGITRTFTYICRNYAMDEEGDRQVLDFNSRVVDDDKPIVEAQRPEALPFDITAELHIRHADKLSIEYRQWLYQLAETHARSRG